MKMIDRFHLLNVPLMFDFVNQTAEEGRNDDECTFVARPPRTVDMVIDNYGGSTSY